MKNYILLGLVILFLFGCDLQPKEQVETISENCPTCYLSEEYVNSRLSQKLEYTNDNKIKKVQFFKGEKKADNEAIIYDYDEEGKLASWSVLDTLGNMSEQFKYEYNMDSSIKRIYTEKYDIAQEKMLETGYYERDYQIDGTITNQYFTFDEKANDYKAISSSEYRRDLQGNILIEILYQVGDSGEFSKTGTIERAYDNNKSRYESFGVDRLFYIKDFAKNNIIKETFKDADGNIVESSKSDIECNEHGYCIKEVITDEQTNVVTVLEFKY